VLLIKLALVALALAWGAAHRVFVVPAVARGREGVFARLPRSVLGESLAGMAVLLVAAVLVDSKPPPQPAARTPARVSGPVERVPGNKEVPRTAREGVR
jgi:hypothetical protein